MVAPGTTEWIEKFDEIGYRLGFIFPVHVVGHWREYGWHVGRTPEEAFRRFFGERNLKTT